MGWLTSLLKVLQDLLAVERQRLAVEQDQLAVLQALAKELGPKPAVSLEFSLGEPRLQIKK